MKECFHLFNYLLLVFFVFSNARGQDLEVYITPSHDQPCAQQPCSTLSDLDTTAGNLTSYSHMVLSIQSGNHSLDKELLVRDVANVTISAIGGDAMIKCTSQSVRFEISNADNATIIGLHFVGCGGNVISQVNQFELQYSTFEGMEGTRTALILNDTTMASIVSCYFLNNTVGSTIGEFDIPAFVRPLLSNVGGATEIERVGGAIIAIYSSMNISNVTFERNSAQVGTSIFIGRTSNVSIVNSRFAHEVNDDGLGAVFVDEDCNFEVSRSTFSNNNIRYGTIVTFKGTATLCSTFVSNTATYIGGAILQYNSSTIISGSTFIDNTATLYGGAIAAFGGGSCSVADSTFRNNRAYVDGGDIMYVPTQVADDINGILNVSNCSFTGGVVNQTSLINMRQGSLHLHNTTYRNYLIENGILINLFLISVNFSGTTTFTNNSGSLYISNSNVTFSGHSEIINSRGFLGQSAFQEGGALISILSAVAFAGTSKFVGNQGQYGGAILAIESMISMSDATTIANNSATFEGGGLSLRQSRLELNDNLIFSQNTAPLGGGIHAVGSTILSRQPGRIYLINNNASNGGGIHLSGYSRVLILKSNLTHSGLILTGNKALYGGGFYVDDESNPGACSSSTECFIQSYSTTLQPDSISVLFSNNTALESGCSIFGGLLNRCARSANVPFFDTERFGLFPSIENDNGVRYIGRISDVTLDIASIASLPVQVCFCDNQSRPICNETMRLIHSQITKGELFTISLVAVDQIQHPVEATIISSLLYGGLLLQGQQAQVNTTCTEVSFSVASPSDREVLEVLADGPCQNSEPSARRVEVVFHNCTCPIGFQPSNDNSVCKCECDSRLREFGITDCDISTNSIIRQGTNIWITYINESGQSGFVVHRVCPFDYCRPSNETVRINLNLPNGADALCANNRAGVLCGTCKESFSLSLGSTACVHCEDYWPAVCFAIIVASVIAGILLVGTLLVLNLTVAGGYINVFIFYANVIAASTSSYFTFSESPFPAVFISWLNLDIGINVCFIDGLDAYTKTWLELAFPAYIISLVVVVIVVSEYSPRFAKLVGKRDPVATLATLVLLSYTKLLSTSFLLISYARIDYPNQTSFRVWLPDATVRDNNAKIIGFNIVAGVIILVGFLYTTLLFSWQWLIRAPRWKILSWTKNVKLNAFVSTYHAPYNSSYRYWTGLLLFVRVALYVISAATASIYPQVPLLVTIILLGSIILVKEIVGMRVYKNVSVDILETVMYFNLLIFASFSQSDFGTSDSQKQAAVSYTSTLITFCLLVSVVVYHISIQIYKNRKTTPVTSVSAPAPVIHSIARAPTSSEITLRNDYIHVEVPYRESIFATNTQLTL